MKSSQAFSLLRILNKTGVLEEVKEKRIKKHEIALKRERLFDRIRFKHAMEIKTERDRLRELVAKEELTPQEMNEGEVQFLLGIFDSEHPAEYDELLGYNAILGNFAIDYASIAISAVTRGEKDLCEWIADYKGITVEEIENDMSIIIITVEEVMQDPNLSSLFKSLNIGI
jgi:hypothetical protein